MLRQHVHIAHDWVISRTPPDTHASHHLVMSLSYRWCRVFTNLVFLPKHLDTLPTDTSTIMWDKQGGGKHAWRRGECSNGGKGKVKGQISGGCVQQPETDPRRGREGRKEDKARPRAHPIQPSSTQSTPRTHTHTHTHTHIHTHTHTHAHTHTRIPRHLHCPNLHTLTEASVQYRHFSTLNRISRRAPVHSSKEVDQCGKTLPLASVWTHKKL